jgi:hypothetical protein
MTSKKMYVRLVDCEPDHVLVPVELVVAPLPDIISAIATAVGGLGRNLTSVYMECLEDGHRQYFLRDAVMSEDFLLTTGHISGNLGRHRHVWWFATTIEVS